MISNNQWCKYFKEVLNVDTVDDNIDNVLQNIVHETNADELNMPISDTEIIESINSLKIKTFIGSGWAIF